MSPVCGEPRIVQATPATSGGTNSGTSPAVAISALHGVLVRTTIQAKPSPMTTAIAVPPLQTISLLTSGNGHFSENAVFARFFGASDRPSPQIVPTGKVSNRRQRPFLGH